MPGDRESSGSHDVGAQDIDQIYDGALQTVPTASHAGDYGSERRLCGVMMECVTRYGARKIRIGNRNNFVLGPVVSVGTQFSGTAIDKRTC